MMASGRSNNLLNGLILATVALFALIAIPELSAQVHGVPASVTSIGFGGHFGSAPGVPASVTSLGPHGFGGNQFFTRPSFGRGFPGNQHFPHHHNQGFFGGAYPILGYGIPYAYPVEVPVAVPDDYDADEYQGGPTIFDRRGPGPSNRQDEERYTSRRDDRDADSDAPAARPAAEEPVANQPDTALVFKDGHSVEVSNYAIVGSTLYDLTPGHSRKILLADLDVAATEKQNDDRGIDFNVPVTQ